MKNELLKVFNLILIGVLGMDFLSYLGAFDTDYYRIFNRENYSHIFNLLLMLNCIIIIIMCYRK